MVMAMTDLPNDLESEILSRVPAKSLRELRVTCKMGKSVRESMLLSNYGVYSIAHNNGLEPSIEFTSKLRSVKGLKDLNISQIFHCDGLVLCSTKENTRRRLVVWNPCTGPKRKIKPRNGYSPEDRYALGYSRSSSSCRSYKILRFCFYQNNPRERVWVTKGEIYELSSDSWRVLDSFTLDYTLYCNGVSLRGDAYFVAGDDEIFLVKFDFTTERFASLPLPVQIISFVDNVVLSVVGDEKLSVLHTVDGSDVLRIWVSNQVDEDEAKDLSWDCDVVLTVDFDKFHLPSLMNVESFLLDEMNKTAMCCQLVKREYKTRIYIVGEDMFQQVYNDSAELPCLNWPLVISYVPNLVCIH